MGLFDIFRRNKDYGNESTAFTCDYEHDDYYIEDPYGLLDDYYDDMLDRCKEISSWLGDLEDGMNSKLSPGWGHGNNFNTWSSITTTTSKKNLKNHSINSTKNNAIEVMEKRARELAASSWEEAVEQAQFVLALATLLVSEARKGVRVVFDMEGWCASKFIAACDAACLSSYNFPLDEQETQRAFAIATGNYFVSSEFDEGTELAEYVEHIGDMQSIWRYASKQFAGHDGLVPVYDLGTYMKDGSTCAVRVEDAKVLASLTAAEVMFDSYLSGVPVEDITA